MKRTATQNRQMHSLLTQAGLSPYKEALVYNYTCQRTGSSAEMSYYEANNLIAYLKRMAAEKRAKAGASAPQNVPARSAEWEQCNRLRRALIAQSYSIGEGVSFVKGWCEKMGVNGEKKGFNQYNAHELRGLLEKFKKVVEHRVNSVVKE